MLTAVVLGGNIAERLGCRREWELDLSLPSPTEAARALCAIVPGMRRLLLGHEAGFHVFSGDRDVGPQEVANATGDTITIMPAVSGAGDGQGLAVFQVIAGAVLIAGGILGSIFIPGFASFAPSIVGLGVSMFLGGASRLLFGPPDASSPSESNPRNQPSYSFDQPVNTVAPGHPVPVCYGLMQVGSQVISAGLVIQWANTGAFGGTGGTDNHGVDGSGPHWGTCLSPNEPIEIDEEQPGGKARRPAYQVVAGFRVRTRPDAGGGYGLFAVEEQEIIDHRPRRVLELEDGRAFICTPNHRVATLPARPPADWAEVRSLRPGDALDGPEPGVVKGTRRFSDGPVVRLSVAGARTYVSKGILHHNAKRAP